MTSVELYLALIDACPGSERDGLRKDAAEVWAGMSRRQREEVIREWAARHPKAEPYVTPSGLYPGDGA